MTVHPRTIRKAIQSARCDSCSSDGNSDASSVAECPASDTLDGIFGIRGTWGNRKAKKDEPSGFGRRLFDRVKDKKFMIEIRMTHSC